MESSYILLNSGTVLQVSNERPVVVLSATSDVVALTESTTFHNLSTESTGNFPDAPADGAMYVRKDAGWQLLDGDTLPNDSYLYTQVGALNAFKEVALGTTLNRFVKFGELRNLGLIKEDGTKEGPVFLETPPMPIGFKAVASIGSITVSWFPALNMYTNHGKAEVYRNTANTLTGATKIADLPHADQVIDTAIEKSVVYYYWVRFVSIAGVNGPYNSTNGTVANSAGSVAQLIDLLESEITAGQLHQDLLTPIDMILGPTGLAAQQYEQAQALIAETAARTAGLLSEAQARINASVAEAEARATAIQNSANVLQNKIDETKNKINILGELTKGSIDTIKRWDFNSSSEGWVSNGGVTVYTGGAIYPAFSNNTHLTSPSFTLTGTSFSEIRFRIIKVGNPVWDGSVDFTTTANSTYTSVSIDEPDFVDSAAIVSCNMDIAAAWSMGNVNSLRIQCALTTDVNNFFKYDWIAIGRIAPSASMAAILEEQGARNTAIDAEAYQRTTLATQLTGGYTGTDLDALSYGLIFNERTARTTFESSTVEQMALLSVGSNNQFDYVKIWHFDSGVEGWTGYGTPTIDTAGFLRPANHATDPFIVSPELDINSAKYPQVRLRIRRVGTPIWEGNFFYVTAASPVWGVDKMVTIPTPTFDSDIALITINVSGLWAASNVTQLRFDLYSNQDVSNYFEIDWVAIGRPSPGASSAALASVQSLVLTNDSARVEDIRLATVAIGTKASTTALQALSTTVTDMTSEGGVITQLQNTVAGKASGSALSALTGRVETTEDSISSAFNDLTLLKSKLAFAENTLDPSVWVVGTQGSQGAWTASGAANESEIVLAGAGTVPLGPLGAVEKLWQCQELGDNNQSGGYYVAPTAANKIDKSIGTVFSTFVRHNGATSGHIYHGCALDGGIQTLNGTNDYNPYWVAHPVGFFTPDRWYLLYGVVSPEGTTVPTGLSGIYDCETGLRVADCPDYRCSPGWNGSNQAYRNYWYYSSDTTHKVWFAQPRVVPLNQSLSPWQLMSINPALAGASTALESLDSRVEATEEGLEIESSKVTRLQANQNITNLIRNPFFDWPDGVDRPTDWGHWTSGAAKHVDGVRFNLAANQAGGIEYLITQNAKFIDVELTFTLVSGSLDGGCISVYWGNGVGWVNANKYLSELFTPAEIYNKKITANIRLRRPDSFSGTFDRIAFYVMGTYSVSATSAKDLIVHAVKVISANESADAIETLISRTTAINGVNGRTLESIAAKTLAIEALVGTAESGAFENLEAKVNDSETGVIASSNKIVQLKNSMPGGGNLIPGDTDFSKDLGGWNLGYNDSNAAGATLKWHTANIAQPSNIKTLELRNQFATTGSCSARIDVPVVAGTRYCFSAYLTAFSAGAELLILWLNSSGGWFATTYSGQVINTFVSGEIKNWHRAKIFETAPEGAVKAALSVFCNAGYGGDPFVFFARPSFNEVSADTQAIPAYTPSSVGLYKNTSDAIETLTTSVDNKDSAQSTKFLNLRAQLEIKSLVANPYFLDWSNGLPVGWNQWNVVAPTQVTSGVQFTMGNGLQGGISFPIPFADYKNIDVELSFTITSGELYGAGIALVWAGTYEVVSKLTDYYAGAYLVLNKKVSLTLRLKRPANVPSNLTAPILYLMGGYSSLGALAAKTIIFHSCVVTASDKSAEATDILDAQVNNTETGLEAVAQKTTLLESTLNGGNASAFQALKSLVTQDVQGNVNALSSQVTALSAVVDGGVLSNLWKHDSECGQLGTAPNWGWNTVVGSLNPQSLQKDYGPVKPTETSMLGTYTNAVSGTFAGVMVYTGTSGYGIPVTGGQAYSFRCKYMLLMGPTAVNVYFTFLTSAGAWISEAQYGGGGPSTSSTLIDNWSDLNTLAIPTPANCAFMQIKISLVGSNVSAGSFAMTRFQFSQGTAGSAAPAYKANQLGTFAQISSELAAQASANSATAGRIDTFKAAVQGNAGGAVSSEFTALQEKFEAVAGVSAQWGVKAQVGDLVGGLGLLIKDGLIEFAIHANRLAIYDPNDLGTPGKFPFIIDAGNVYINSAFIKDATIDSAKIANLDVAKLSGDSQAAIANLLRNIGLSDVNGSSSIVAKTDFVNSGLWGKALGRGARNFSASVYIGSVAKPYTSSLVLTSFNSPVRLYKTNPATVDLNAYVSNNTVASMGLTWYSPESPFGGVTLLSYTAGDGETGFCGTSGTRTSSSPINTDVNTPAVFFSIPVGTLVRFYNSSNDYFECTWGAAISYKLTAQTGQSEYTAKDYWIASIGSTGFGFNFSGFTSTTQCRVYPAGSQSKFIFDREFTSNFISDTAIVSDDSFFFSSAGYGQLSIMGVR